MVKVTCDDCGDDITILPHWEIAFVVPARDGTSAVSETRNRFCVACW